MSSQFRTSTITSGSPRTTKFSIVTTPRLIPMILRALAAVLGKRRAVATEHKLIEGVAHMIWHTNKKGPSARRLAHPGTPGVRRRTWALILAFVLFISGVHVLARTLWFYPVRSKQAGRGWIFSQHHAFSCGRWQPDD